MIGWKKGQGLLETGNDDFYLRRKTPDIFRNFKIPSDLDLLVSEPLRLFPISHFPTWLASACRARYAKVP